MANSKLNVCFLGFGAVAKTVFKMWPFILDYSMDNVIIIDPVEISDEITRLKQSNINKVGIYNQSYKISPYYGEIIFYKLYLNVDNYEGHLCDIVNKHAINLIVDLSVNVDSLSIIEWCQNYKIPYINTAIEDWRSYPNWDGSPETIYEHTLYARQREIRIRYQNPSNTTMVLDMGMNPGLISHFAKKSLSIIAMKKITDDNDDNEALNLALEDKDYALMAKLLNLITIQIAEHDTQVSLSSKTKNIFYNTWSAIGFVEEATDPAQLGWGTHEINYPDGAIIPEKPFPKDIAKDNNNDNNLEDSCESLFNIAVNDKPHQIFLKERGMNTLVHSYEPISGEFIGYCISHGEASALAYYLATEDYRPSVYYVYLPCAAAIDSLNELRLRKYIMQDNYLIYAARNIASGYDSVGALLLFNDNGKIKGFWGGTVVKDYMAKAISPDINATTLQVACGVLAGIDHILKNPNTGVKFPEALDTDRIFELVSPWLGDLYWQWIPYSPKTAQFTDLRV